MARNKGGRTKRARARQYTQQEAAELLGVSRSTVHRMERRFLTPLQRAYLNLIGYEVGYYPRHAVGPLERIEGQAP